jgi:hypothetical protein
VKLGRRIKEKRIVENSKREIGQMMKIYKKRNERTIS